ncbi:MAG: hypothetical protein II304_02650 [Bacteroidales bacterium]|nr:hypothetical protein [Bacteroidales bacterium]
MDEKCIDCQNDTLLKYSALYCDFEKSQRYNKMLENCLDTKDELCKVLREDNEQLRSLLKIYKGKYDATTDN